MTIGISGPFNPYFFKDLFGCKYVPNINKGASAVNVYVNELIRHGHKVIVFTCSIPGEAEDIYLEGGKLRVYIVHSNPGLFVTHGFSRLYMVSRLRKVIAGSIDELDVLHAQWTYDFALAACVFSDRKPVFCTVRDWCPRILEFQHGLKKIQWSFYYLQFISVIKNKKIHLIANSDYIKNRLSSFGVTSNVEVINNPIDISNVISPDLLKIKNRAPSFISISQSASDRLKNLDTLVEAFNIFHQRYPESVLRLVGRGFNDDNKIVIEWKKKGLLDGVILCGFVNHDKLYELIDESTCLVHPSYEESFGNTLIEGMARGIPVIGGVSSGAVPYVLGHGAYGFLCDVSDPMQLCSTMEQCVHSRKLKDIVTAANHFLVDKHSGEVIYRKHMELYYKVISTMV